MTTRRSFLAGAASAAAIALRPHPLWSQADAALTLTVNLQQTLATMPLDFTGLSYESAQLGHPDFFSPQNSSLIAIFKTLGLSLIHI